MSSRALALLALVAVGCGPSGALKVLQNPPSVSILEPYDGDTFEEGEAVTFRGVVDADAGYDGLTVEWVSSIDGLIPDVDPPDASGNVEVSTASLSQGAHVITLRATDLNALQGEDEVTIEILDVPDLPSITIDHPTGDENGLEGSVFIFAATVADAQDPAEDLTVEVSADSGGLVCQMTVDGGGNAQCGATLAVGEYVLTFTVEDTEGNFAQALTPFSVLSPDDFDFDGDGYSVNGGDCNDSNDTVYPGAPEICDGLDNDCTEATGIDVGSECYDDDGDGYCEAPPCINTSNTAVDCDDTLNTVSPVAAEVLNARDDNCDGRVDEGTVVYDDDGDGHCESPPCVNVGSTQSDCDDGNSGVSPTATEACGDGVDNNCNGQTNEQNARGCSTYYYDGDSDGYGVSTGSQCWCSPGSYPYTATTTGDCYDSNALAKPGTSTYYTSHRGDGSYDYNCSGSDERQYTTVSGGCAWDIVYLDCDVNGAGWSSSAPSCGSTGQIVNGCEAVYDPLCYAYCVAFSSDPFTCIISTCGATCSAEYTPTTQACR
jgi:hypothetical protein